MGGFIQGGASYDMQAHSFRWNMGSAMEGATYGAAISGLTGGVFGGIGEGIGNYNQGKGFFSGEYNMNTARGRYYSGQNQMKGWMADTYVNGVKVNSIGGDEVDYYYSGKYSSDGNDYASNFKLDRVVEKVPFAKRLEMIFGTDDSYVLNGKGGVLLGLTAGAVIGGYVASTGLIYNPYSLKAIDATRNFLYKDLAIGRSTGGIINKIDDIVNFLK